MKPRSTSAARYHQSTSYARHRLTPHTLAWNHLPRPVKRYAQCPRIPLPPVEKLPAVDFLELIRRAPAARHRAPDAVTLGHLSTLFRLTHAVTARRRNAGPSFAYRSVASAGALYPFELYLAAHDIADLAPGIYHHHLFEAALTQLRPGPVAPLPPVTPDPVATFYITGIFFRSAWKYRSRAYRYVLLDAGHLLENLRLALHALRLPFSIHLDFDDAQAATLLGVNPQQEGCLISVHLHAGSGEKKPAGALGTLEPLAAETLAASTVSDREVTYADIHDIHRAGVQAGQKTADASPAPPALVPAPSTWIDLGPSLPAVSADYVDTLQRRRSRRNFVGSDVGRNDLMTCLDMMVAGMGSASDMPAASRSALTIGCLAGDGMPIAPGFYRLDVTMRRLGQVHAGRLIPSMAAACLDQMWLAQAGVHLLFLANLSTIDRCWGARGYRYAMIEAGRLGQLAYLAATAIGWGACGIGAIYDREAAQLLNLEKDACLLYLVGAGPVKRH